MQIISGKLQKAKKVLIYGVAGVGKSTIASQFPDPLFIDTEGSTGELDVKRFQKPTSWTMFLQQVDYVKVNKPCKTLVIDTIDWAEPMAMEYTAQKNHVSSIAQIGYGQGYNMHAEEWGKFLNKLEDIVEKGINVVLLAHAEVKRMDEPSEMGSYDRWSLKLEKKTSPLTKDWADMVLFANYKVFVVQTKEKKNKAQGGQRVMYTNYRPSHDAKNRYGLPDEIPFSYESIRHIIEGQSQGVQPNIAPQVAPQILQPVAPQHKPTPTPTPMPTQAPITEPQPQPKVESQPVQSAVKTNTDSLPGVPKNLADLMKLENVTVAEIQKVVSSKGYFPENTPIENYPPDFINGVLVGAWDKVLEAIKSDRQQTVLDIRDEDLPF